MTFTENFQANRNGSQVHVALTIFIGISCRWMNEEIIIRWGKKMSSSSAKQNSRVSIYKSSLIRQISQGFQRS